MKSFLSINKQQEAQEAAQVHSIMDIHTSAETLGNLTMDELLDIAKRTPATGAQKGMKPMDRVLVFLQQEQKLLKEEKEMKRNEAIRELVTEQNAAREQQQQERLKSNKKVEQYDSKQLVQTKNMLKDAMSDAHPKLQQVAPENLV